jgi:hypothetical protein
MSVNASAEEDTNAITRRTDRDRPIETGKNARGAADTPRDGRTIRETLYFRAPEDGIAATHDGDPHKPVRPFPSGIATLEEENIDTAFVLVAKARDANGVVVGFASEMEEVAPESNLAEGRMIMYSTWTIELPGRGTLFCFEIEDASEFAAKVLVPTITEGTIWDEPWTFTTTIGPAASGRGVIIGGTGEFSGVTGEFTEVTHLERFTPGGELALVMELQLEYQTASDRASGESESD